MANLTFEPVCEREVMEMELAKRLAALDDDSVVRVNFGGPWTRSVQQIFSVGDDECRSTRIQESRPKLFLLTVVADASEASRISLETTDSPGYIPY